MLLHRFFWSGYCLFHALGQRSIPFAPPERWKALQRKRIKQIVTHAYESVPFYRTYMLEEGLKRDLQSLLGDEAQIDILFVKAFPITPRGKF